VLLPKEQKQFLQSNGIPSTANCLVGNRALPFIMAQAPRAQTFGGMARKSEAGQRRISFPDCLLDGGIDGYKW